MADTFDKLVADLKERDDQARRLLHADAFAILRLDPDGVWRSSWSGATAEMLGVLDLLRQDLVDALREPSED